MEEVAVVKEAELLEMAKVADGIEAELAMEATEMEEAPAREVIAAECEEMLEMAKVADEIEEEQEKMQELEVTKEAMKTEEIIKSSVIGDEYEELEMSKVADRIEEEQARSEELKFANEAMEEVEMAKLADEMEEEQEKMEEVEVGNEAMEMKEVIASSVIADEFEELLEEEQARLKEDEESDHDAHRRNVRLISESNTENTGSMADDGRDIQVVNPPEDEAKILEKAEPDEFPRSHNNEMTSSLTKVEESKRNSCKILSTESKSDEMMINREDKKIDKMLKIFLLPLGHDKHILSNISEYEKTRAVNLLQRNSITPYLTMEQLNEKLGLLPTSGEKRNPVQQNNFGGSNMGVQPNSEYVAPEEGGPDMRRSGKDGQEAMLSPSVLRPMKGESYQHKGGEDNLDREGNVASSEELPGQHIDDSDQGNHT